MTNSIDVDKIAKVAVISKSVQFADHFISLPFILFNEL